MSGWFSPDLVTQDKQSEPVSSDDEFARMLADLRDDSPGWSRQFSKLYSKLKGAQRPVIGDQVGAFYTVEEVLSPTLFVVHHRRVNRRFVLRVLGTETADSAQERAALAASSVGHDNIVFVTHFAHSKRFGRYYVMEYLRGMTLRDTLAGDPSAREELALDVAVNVGAGLAAAHEIGVVHGDVRPGRIMYDGRNWKLLAFGPRAFDEDALSRVETSYLAPEIVDERRARPASDQFALAATLWCILHDSPPWEPVEWQRLTRRSAAVAGAGAADEVLCRALAADPAQRFDAIEELVGALRMALGRTRTPSVPGVDAAEGALVASGELDVKVGPDSTRDRETTAPSIEIDLENLPDLRMRIGVTFRTASRLRREWRRNLIGGGLFVPTKRRLEPASPVIVSLKYLPTGAESSFPAEVIEYITAEPAGLAIEILPALHEALRSFIADQQVESLRADAVVSPRRAPASQDELSPDEQFIATLLVEPSAVANLRAQLGGLPIDVDSTIVRLEDIGILRVQGDETALRRSVTPPAAPRELADLSLQRAEYFRSVGNFTAEHTTLELAAAICEDARLWYRLAINKVQFGDDVAGAVDAMKRAVDCAPHDELYTRALTDLAQFSGK